MPENPRAGLQPPAIVELDEVDSTNAEAMRRAAAGERGPIWLLARRQMAGRGRLGRTWSSLEGNLMATLLFEPGLPVARQGELSLVAGVAAHAAITVLRPIPRLRLKWPNDILIGDAKLGGILVECTAIGNAAVAAVGIGINLVGAPQIMGRSTTAIAYHARPPSRAEMLEALSASMSNWLDVWRGPAGFAPIRQAWLERAGPEGEPTSVNTGATIHAGSFGGIDHDGALLLRLPDGGLKRCTFGDVTLTNKMDANERGPHGG